MGTRRGGRTPRRRRTLAQPQGGGESVMAAVEDIVFLFDVDNTLLDNDRIQEELRDHLRRTYGDRACARYWAHFQDLWGELGYAFYLGALERYRLEELHDPSILRMGSWLVDYPFADRLYPQ